MKKLKHQYQYMQPTKVVKEPKKAVVVKAPKVVEPKCSNCGGDGLVKQGSSNVDIICPICSGTGK